MSTDTEASYTGDGENPMLQIMHRLTQMAMAKGVACLEFCHCPGCGITMFVPHPHSERIVCPECKTSFPSKSPRPLGHQEVTAEHLYAAIDQAMLNNSPTRFGATPITIDQFGGGADAKMAILSFVAQEVRLALQKVRSDAELLAKAV